MKKEKKAANRILEILEEEIGFTHRKQAEPRSVIEVTNADLKRIEQEFLKN